MKIIFLLVLSIIKFKESPGQVITPCPLSLSVPLLNSGDMVHHANGTLFHQGVLYSPEHFYIDGDKIYGCPCNIKGPCIRKCCQKNQALTNTDRPQCININETLADILPHKHQLANDLRTISGVSKYFNVIHNNICTSGTYRLEPEQYEEDNFILHSNGSLFAIGELLPQWRYCMDWQDNFKTIIVLICHRPENEIDTATTTIYPLGIIISIPFLLATLIVYSITPELRNLYGMTLMCYVGCLIAAYSFLAGGQLIYHGQPMCVIAGEFYYYIYYYLLLIPMA